MTETGQPCSFSVQSPFALRCRLAWMTSVGGLENHLGGAVVLLQQDDLGVGIVLLEAEDIAQVGGAPGIYRLVGVADDAHVAVFARQLLDQLVLHEVGVLELVDHDVQVARLVALPGLGAFLEKLDGLEEQVVEVERFARR